MTIVIFAARAPDAEKLLKQNGLDLVFEVARKLVKVAV